MPESTVKRHPIRGVLWGVLMGIGLAVTAIGMKRAAVGTNAPFVFFAIGLVISVAWSLFGPAKAPKGPAPAEPAAEPDPEPEPEPAAEAEPEDAAPEGVADPANAGADLDAGSGITEIT